MSHTMVTYLILMVGPPGSGKSTFLPIVCNGMDDPTAFTDYQVVCPDDIRAELSGDAGDQSVSAEAWETAYSRTSAALEAGRTVVFDAVLVNPKTRRKLVACAKKYEAQVVYITMGTARDVCQARNAGRTRVVPAHVVDNFYDRFETEFPCVIKDRQ